MQKEKSMSLINKNENKNKFNTSFFYQFFFSNYKFMTASNIMISMLHVGFISKTTKCLTFIFQANHKL